jgi:hypothetical protein
LRWKLIVGILSGITLLLGAAGTAAYFAIKERLYSEFDRSLVQRTVLLASMIEEDAGVIIIEWLENGSSPPGHQPGVDYFAIWTKHSSEPLAASTGLGKGTLPRFGGSFGNPELRNVVLPGNRAARCAGIEFDVRRGLRNEDDADEKSSSGIAGRAATASAGTIVQLVIAKVDTVGPTLRRFSGR